MKDKKMRNADYSFTIYMAFKAFVFLVAALFVWNTPESGGLLIMSAISLAFTPLVAFGESKITYNR